MKSFRRNAALVLATLMMFAVAGTTAANAQIYTVVYNFDGNHGAFPGSTPTQGRDGNLYGTTFAGGGKGQGVVFGITLSGTLKGVYRFDGGTHGGQLQGGLTLGTDGAFYGTTYDGGNSKCFHHTCGTVFKITNSGSLTTLYTFTGGADGGAPMAPPVQGVDGNFYGTTNMGTAYRITSSGTFTPLGLLPWSSQAPLLQASDGNFYGTTYGLGGPSYNGTVFKMTAKGVVTTVYSFDGVDGENPTSPVIQGGDGNLYGTTLGGAYCEGGNGTAFMLTLQGDLTVLHNFPDPNYPNDGACPSAGLMQATDGNFYGVTSSGGVNHSGVIFQITPAGNYSILYDFFDYSQGAGPVSSVMQHTNGKIYGTANGGGTLEYGAVFSLDMGLGPFVRLVSPAGRVGKTVEVLGQGFRGTTGVSFNGTAANFKVVSDTFLGAEVPSGAATGPVTVTTPSGTLTSDKPFIVIR